MPKSRFRTLARRTGLGEGVAEIVATARPLAVLMQAAEQDGIDQRTAHELLLLLQCITDMTWQLQLDTRTVTERFQRWAGGSSKPWWGLYRDVMSAERHATAQMLRESL